MSTDYDKIADQYSQAKAQPWRHHVELYTLIDLTGPVRGLSVLDLACGDGFYTRLLRQRGASQAHGVDLSREMIRIAQQREDDDPLGITYSDADVLDFTPEEPVDLVNAAYLLNYAEDAKSLRAMCDGVSRCLQPGGRFVTVNTSPFLDFSSAPDYRPFGFEARADAPWREGSRIDWTFHIDDQSIQVENYHLSPETHKQALEAAGFEAIIWHPARANPKGAAASPTGSWDPLLEPAPIAFLECRKRG
jgi:ubiquinone/menaquinone biosynthesis C-methylase UbiE